MKGVVELLTAVLGLGNASADDQKTLELWVDTYVPGLIKKAQLVLAPPFSVAELMDLAEDAVLAAQALHGVFTGKQRAQAAQIVLVFAARAALPDLVEPWVIPLLSGEGVTAFIEAAFQKVFGPEKVPVTGIPVNPAGGDNALGRPATDADFGPSFKDAPLDPTPH